MSRIDDIDDMGEAKEHKLQLEIDQQNRDSAINRAMAEVAGWTDCHKSLAGFDDGDGITERYNIGIPPNSTLHRKIPNYLTDLNAVHEVEMNLTNNQHRKYRKTLAQVCHCSETRSIRSREIVSSTARQRCTAILKTLNRWNPEWDYPI